MRHNPFRHLSMNLQNLWKKSSISLLYRFGDYFFPPLCILCDQPRDHQHRWFCRACNDLLKKNHNNRAACPVCSVNKNHHQCSCDIETPFSFTILHAILDYDQTTQAIMHNIKYRGKKRLAYDMGYQFAKLLPEGFLKSFDIAIPIPLYWTRKLSRGYNQAEYFGKGILEGAGSSVPLHADIVKRTRSTGTQTKLDKTSRKRNMSDAFKIVNLEIIKGKHVLLFDDVVTTGATVNACSRTLLANGCASVQVCALARD